MVAAVSEAPNGPGQKMAAGTGHRVFSLEHTIHGPKGASKPLERSYFAILFGEINVLRRPDPNIRFPARSHVEAFRGSLAWLAPASVRSLALQQPGRPFIGASQRSQQRPLFRLECRALDRAGCAIPIRHFSGEQGPKRPSSRRRAPLVVKLQPSAAQK